MARTGEGKTAVVGWGRGMGHKGHMYLASSVITHANQLGADPYFVVSKTVGKDDPITPDEKIAIYKKVFPQSGHIFQPATDEIPDLTRVLANLNQQGYTGVTVVLGADQVKAFQYLKNYNNKPDKSGNILYNFDNLDVISRQETDDPSKDQEGPRATPMRQALMDPNKSEEEQFQVWRDAMSPQIGDDEVRDLMTKAKERMTAMSAPKPKKAKVAPVNELSSEKLGQYKKAAGAQASAADKAGDFKKADKRFSGIVKATKKQFANDEKSVGEARKKKPRNKDNLSKYFFPGYGYYGYGGSNDSGEGGGDSGGEGVAEGPQDDPEDYRAHLIKTLPQMMNFLAKSVNGWKPTEEQYLAAIDTGYEVMKHTGNVQQAGKAISDELNTLHRMSQRKSGMMEERMSAAVRLARAADRQRAKSDASLRRTPSSIPKAEPKKDEKTAEGAPIVVAQAPIHIRNPKKDQPKQRYMGDIVPPTQPPSTEKRGVKGRPGQRPMPKYDVEEAKKKGADGKACWKNYRYNGTENGKDKCVPVGEGVENIMDNLINKIIVNEAVQNNRK